MEPMVGDSRDVSGPQLRYSRLDDAPASDSLTQALALARQIEELLEETRSVVSPLDQLQASTHSTRMARAMAASLVDELEVLARPQRSSVA
jgi:hypothetical protein